MKYIKRSDDTRTCHDRFILIDDIKRLSEYVVENQMTEESLTYDYDDFYIVAKADAEEQLIRAREYYDTIYEYLKISKA